MAIVTDAIKYHIQLKLELKFKISTKQFNGKSGIYNLDFSF